MKRKVKRIVLPLLFMLLVCSAGRSVAAAEEFPDLSQKGSISITMKNEETGAVVPGGTIQLFQVADAVESDGDYSFEFTDAFAGCGQSLKEIGSETLADDLAEYAVRENIKGMVVTVGADGKADFETLMPGLYLVVQKSAADGYNVVSPFLVSVPMYSAEGDRWIYDVDASPKMEPVTAQPSNPEPGTDPEDPGSPTTPGKPDTPPGGGGNSSGTGRGTLPQTGQLNWPIPVMSITGVLLFAAGWKLHHKNEEEQSEEQSGEQRL